MTTELGRRVKDRITGFTGVVTGRVEYITGCNLVLVAPPLGPDGALRDSAWFDEQHVTYVDEERITIDNGSNPGFDKAAPVR